MHAVRVPNPTCRATHGSDGPHAIGASEPEPAHVTETRASYDAVAEDYAVLMRAALHDEPVLRGMLGAFAELVRAAGSRRVLDAGCGPGHVTAHLKSTGVDAFGVDLSPRMVEVARREHPGVDFEVGSMTSLRLADGGLGGVVACWSIIHLLAAEVPIAIAEFHRVLDPGGTLMLGFHIGEGASAKAEWLRRPSDDAGRAAMGAQQARSNRQRRRLRSHRPGGLQPHRTQSGSSRDPDSSQDAGAGIHVQVTHRYPEDPLSRPARRQTKDDGSAQGDAGAGRAATVRPEAGPRAGPLAAPGI